MSVLAGFGSTDMTSTMRRIGLIVFFECSEAGNVRHSFSGGGDCRLR